MAHEETLINTCDKTRQKTWKLQASVEAHPIRSLHPFGQDSASIWQMVKPRWSYGRQMMLRFKQLNFPCLVHFHTPKLSIIPPNFAISDETRTCSSTLSPADEIHQDTQGGILKSRASPITRPCSCSTHVVAAGGRTGPRSCAGQKSNRDLDLLGFIYSFCRILPAGNVLHSYWTWWFIVDLPISPSAPVIPSEKVFRPNKNNSKHCLRRCWELYTVTWVIHHGYDSVPEGHRLSHDSLDAEAKLDAKTISSARHHGASRPIY